MDKPKVMSVPAAGEMYFDCGRDKSYQLAKEGIIPTIRVGRKLVVPLAAMEVQHACLTQVGEN